MLLEALGHCINDTVPLLCRPFEHSFAFVFKGMWAKTVWGLEYPIFESLDEGEVENRKHEKRMHPLPNQITKHQTSFFDHEVFEYFLPAQKVFCPAGKGGEAKKNNLTIIPSCRLGRATELYQYKTRCKVLNSTDVPTNKRNGRSKWFYHRNSSHNLRGRCCHYLNAY